MNQTEAKIFFDKIIEEYQNEAREDRLILLFEFLANALEIDDRNENLDATILDYDFESYVELLKNS